MLDLPAGPAGEVGGVARSLVPDADETFFGFGRLVFELVHHDGGAASGEEQEGEAGIGDGRDVGSVGEFVGVGVGAGGVVAGGGLPGAVGVLVFDDEVCALVVPVGGAEVFASAGDADAFYAVEGVVILGGDDLVDVVVHPGESALDGGV